MSDRWRQYITGSIEAAGGLLPFALAQWAYLFPVYLAIRRALPQGGRVLDVGCGAAIFSGLLAHHGYAVLGVDEDIEIVSYARQVAAELRSPLRVEQATAFDLSSYHGQFDLAYSLGVVEHFDAEVTASLIAEQARCASLVLVAVPSRHAACAAPVTDERLYSRHQLAALVRRAGCRVRESFVFGELPTAFARNCERVLPGAAYRGFKHLLTYGMEVCCVAERP